MALVILVLNLNMSVFANTISETDDHIKATGLIEVTSDYAGGEYRTYSGEDYPYYEHIRADGIAEAAYNNGEVVISEVYENGRLIDKKIYTDDFFVLQIITEKLAY